MDEKKTHLPKYKKVKDKSKCQRNYYIKKQKHIPEKEEIPPFKITITEAKFVIDL